MKIVFGLLTRYIRAGVRGGAPCLTGFGVVFTALAAVAGDPISIADRRELFVDHLLIDRLNNVQLRLHHPVKAPRPESPLPTAAYITVIKDRDEQGHLYRAYWRGHDSAFKGQRESGDGGELVRYGESRDGHEWTFPKLGLHEVAGSRDNNVILAKMPSMLHNFSPFLDTRPGVPPDRRFKALAGHPGPGDKRGEARPGMGLFAFFSADGTHWQKHEEVIPYRNEWRHAFDSQNVAFWSPAEQQYVCYFRTWTEPERLRSISRTTSKDFHRWTEPVAMNPNYAGEHLYTSQTHPYFRAPHIYIALPTRYVPGRGDPAASRDYNNATDILFMTSRAGSTHFDRTFGEAFIRPGTDPQAWLNRANYVALNVVPTSPTEMSIYHRSGDRYVLRTDGFASAHAGFEDGELVTRPLTFRGHQLHVNVSTSAAGSLKVELQQPDGTPFPGYSIDDCDAVYGDQIDRTVSWQKKTSVASLAGRVVRLRFLLRECDLYSFQFPESATDR